MDNESLLIGLERFACCNYAYCKLITEDARSKHIDISSRVFGLFADGSATFARFSIKTAEAEFKMSCRVPLNLKDLEDHTCDDVTYVMLDGKELIGAEKYNIAMSAILKDLIEDEFNDAKVTMGHAEPNEDGDKRYITDYYKAELSDGTCKIKCKNKYFASDNTIKALNIIENNIGGSYATKVGDVDVTVNEKDLEYFRKGDFDKSSFIDFREGLVVVLKEHITTKEGEMSKREVKYSYKHYSMINRDLTADSVPAAVNPQPVGNNDAQEVATDKQDTKDSKEANLSEENE